MTVGNMIDLGVILTLNIMSTISCYMYYFPEGYPESKKAVRKRRFRISTSLLFGFVDIFRGIISFVWEKIQKNP